MSTAVFVSLKTGQEWVAEAPPSAQLCDREARV